MVDTIMRAKISFLKISKQYQFGAKRMSETRAILIIDDSRVSRMMVKAIVKQHYPEAPIFEAGDAEETLALDINDELTHIICDYNMPGMDGLTLSVKLKELYPNAYITLLTANIQAATRHKAEDMGIRFTKKPVTEERILSILSKDGSQ